MRNRKAKGFRIEEGLTLPARRQALHP